MDRRTLFAATLAALMAASMLAAIPAAQAQDTPAAIRDTEPDDSFTLTQGK